MKSRPVSGRRKGGRVSRSRGRWWLLNGSYYDEDVEKAKSHVQWVEERPPRKGAAKRLREWSKRIAKFEYGKE